jgi:hypothetical protein
LSPIKSTSPGVFHRLQLDETLSCVGLSNLVQFEESQTERGRCASR